MKTTLLITTLLALVSLAKAQPFQNLGFEQANTNALVPVPYLGPPSYPGAGLGTVNDLLPGWRLFSGDQEVTAMGFNYPSGIQLSYASIIDENYPGLGSLEGYTLRLYRGPGADHYSITQRGGIPTDAVYMTFQSRSSFTASIDGEDLSPIAEYFSTGSFRANVSQYAGQTVELTLRTYDPFLPQFGAYEIDSIAFVVPEPSTYALLALGAAALAGRWLWRRKRQQ